MKFFALFCLFFSTPVFALDSSSGETYPVTRFDGVYRLMDIQGTGTYYHPVRCTDPVSVDQHTIDARNVKCNFEERPMSIQNVCSPTLYVRGLKNRVHYSRREISLEPSYSADPPQSIQNTSETYSTCTGLNPAVCLLIRATSFYDRRKEVSLKNSISREDIKGGFDKDYVSLSKVESGLILKRTNLRHWAGPEHIPNKMEDYNVRCTYKLITE